MPRYKNIRVKKPNGGSRMQRVQVLKSGKYKFVKNTGRARSTPKRTSRKRARTYTRRAAPRRRRTSMARRRKKRGGGRKGIRVAATAGILIGSVMLIKNAMDLYKSAGPEAAGRGVVQSLTGYNMASGAWNLQDARFTLPAIAGCATSMIASKVGLNRYTPKGLNI